MINLISDTVTKPTPQMLDYMLQAAVGDDVFGADPSVQALQDRMAAMFGHEAALFCPSGTMTNQIAIKCHTQPLDEVICDHYSHVYQYETAGYAFHSGVAMHLLEGQHGKLTAPQINAAIRPDYDWLPHSSLVVLENSCNKAGGSYYTLDEIQPITDLCRARGLALHLDGARLFNVLVETGETTVAVGALFDSISICLSKGLGAPVGSILIGSSAMIKQARRYRKVMGGGMRQAGYLAAAGTYALDHHIDRLADDNARARQLGHAVEQLHYVDTVAPVQTNICICHLHQRYTAQQVLDHLAGSGIHATAFGPQTIRLVTHMHIDDSMIEQVIQQLKRLDK